MHLLAFQVWDSIGWAGQGLFAARMLLQWYRSERAGRTVVPRSFWVLSLLGALCIVVYQFHRKDPVFLVGALVNAAIYARNLSLDRRESGAARRQLGALLLGVGAFAAVVLLSVQSEHKVVQFDEPLLWMVFGFAAQTIWSSRFVVQWVVSERLGRSTLSPAFFWISLIGAVGLFVYSIYREDWVMMAAYALNPIPYVRNLILISRHRSAEPDA